MVAPRLKENLEGRIRNLALSPSTPGNSLVPLFEAIYNSIHAIEERFAQEAVQNGRISVLIEKDDNIDTCNIIITDNGIGLNDEQFEAFCTIDTSAKLRRGGKGIGRLTWLRVFERARVISRFKDGGETKRRSFVFCRTAKYRSKTII
jgi:hypothetical protein